MKIETHTINNLRIAEILSEVIIIETAENGLDLLGTIYYDGYDKVILHEKNITSTFFDLKNGLAGELLQKFSNYRIGLAIVGNFEKYTSKSIRDFIFESNKTGHIIFVSSNPEALKKLSQSSPLV